MPVLEKTTSRRRFLVGAGATAASTALLNGLDTQLAFATPSNPSSGDAVVFIFLRFGADGLSLTPPIGPAFDSYRSLRPTIHITPDQALPLDTSNPNAAFPQGLSGVLGLHPGLRGLYDTVWASGNMAVIPASGMPNAESTSRSHFSMQRYVELGTANSAIRNGWLTRVMDGQAASGIVPGMASSPRAETSFRGNLKTMSIPVLERFGVQGFRRQEASLAALNALYSGDGQVSLNGRAVLAATGAVQEVNADGGSGYPDSPLGRSLRDVANLLRSNVGLTTALVNTQSWDHHSGQGDANSGAFFDRVTELGDALTAFVGDLGPALNETTICVVSEFGRTIDENSAGGTDHGRGGSQFVIGGGVQGGVFGYDFPDVIEDPGGNDRRALPVLTDYRKAFDEIVSNRVGVTGSFPTLGELPDLGITRS